MSLYGRTPQPPPQQNQNLQWERFSVPTGQNLVGRMPVTAFSIANIQVDNLTGSWLQINPGAFLIPPYTLGWSTNFIPSAVSVDILFVQGPNGQISTNTGTSINVALYNQPLGNEVGSNYESNRNLSFVAGGQAINPAGNFSILLLGPAGANAQYRVMGFDFAVSPGNSAYFIAQLNFVNNTNNPPLTAIISSVSGNGPLTYGRTLPYPGIPFGLNNPMYLLGFTPTLNGTIYWSVNYLIDQ